MLANLRPKLEAAANMIIAYERRNERGVALGDDVSRGWRVFHLLGHQPVAHLVWMNARVEEPPIFALRRRRQSWSKRAVPSGGSARRTGWRMSGGPGCATR